ncbi:hypothetical protein D2T29_12755 [Sinirhodobacter populi]|uniref:Uncharacterized protein n=1 Tax=Paenirhodobacter populi TaxID=2306993 RepID=A0A443KCS4_9RHOB|nr:hypothetical protein [Sinirhodobacter populi]RWR30535.1 hypothetical protein D2T29_12755 [Sinirhodobacter populi]
MLIEIVYQPNGVALFTLAYDRPALEGTDKQIAWATDIRAIAEAEIIGALAKQAGVAANRYDTRIPSIAPLAVESAAEAVATINGLLAREMRGITMAQIITEALRTTSASDWIDARYSDARKLLTDAAQRVQGR